MHITALFKHVDYRLGNTFDISWFNKKKKKIHQIINCMHHFLSKTIYGSRKSNFPIGCECAHVGWIQ